MAIISSDPRSLRIAIKNGGEVNATINGKTMLDLAIETNKETPSVQGNIIITILLNNGAKTSEELEVSRATIRPPLSVKGIVRGNIKTGIASLPRRGTRGGRRRNRTRKNRR